MMHILTLKVGPKYSSAYVNNLYKSIKDNSTAPFQMHCYTDDMEGLDRQNINIIQNPFMKYRLQWNKVEFHREMFAGIMTGEQCLILDIDQLCIGDFDPILTHKLEEGQFGCFTRWWSRLQGMCRINGGFQMFRMGETDHLWQKFKSDPDWWTNYYIKRGEAFGKVNGEQNFIDNHVGENRYYFPKEWFGKYNSDDMNVIQRQWFEECDPYEPFFIGGEFASSVKLIHFASSHNIMHKQNIGIVRKYWEADDWNAESYMRKDRQ